MPRKQEKSPLQELAEQADAALHTCWERLHARELTERDIETMVASWRVKRRAHQASEEVKIERKEARESDN